MTKSEIAYRRLIRSIAECGLAGISRERLTQVMLGKIEQLDHRLHALENDQNKRDELEREMSGC